MYINDIYDYLKISKVVFIVLPDKNYRILKKMQKKAWIFFRFFFGCCTVNKRG